MAFTVGYTGTSYVDVAYADAYFADRAVTAWTGQDAAKKGALVRATDYVRALFAPRFDPDKVDPLALPGTLLQAVCQYALVELGTPNGLAPAPSSAESSSVVTKEKIGPIETSYAAIVKAGDGSLAGGTRKSFPVADALIARLLLPSLGLSRVIR